MRHIEVVPWRAEWSARFAHEADSLRAVFGERVRAIHHIGSTSVPGLSAKPIIDTLVVLDSTDDIAAFDAPMERLGYAVKGECLDAEIPGTRGRFYYSRTVDGVRTHQVHACQSGHPEIAQLLAFRDYLRAHPGDAAEYARVKSEAAHRHRESNLDYMRAKDGIVRQLLAKARAWSAAVDAYDALAEAYAAAIDQKPHNAMYERPATLSLLPDVHGRRVLDAGCGPGVHTEWLLDHGATVVALDASERMVTIATQRTGGRAAMHCADLSSPLPFLDDASFDLVICPLVLEYIRDWRPVFAEFHRVLRPGGHVVLSVSHPFHDADYFRTQAYFDTELVHAEWTGFAPVRITMPSFRRSLAETLNPIVEAGFRVETVLEPLPTEQFRVADPVRHARLMHRPAFLCVRAVNR